MIRVVDIVTIVTKSTSGAGHRGGWHAYCLGGVRCNEEGSVEKASRLSRVSRISRGLSRNAFQLVSRCFKCLTGSYDML